MSATATRSVATLALLSAFFILTSCSSQPSGPEPGTPAFKWAAAHEVFTAGDYAKTLENLDNLVIADGEYTARALPWSLLVKSGLSSGYKEIADSYAKGVRTNKTASVDFQRLVSEYRDQAGRYALQFGDDFRKMAQQKGDTVPMDFPFPQGSLSTPALYTKTDIGVSLTPAETDTVLKQSLQKGILLGICRAAGSPDDPAKAQEAIKGGTVPRASFMLAMVHGLYDASELYSTTGLDEPQKRQAILELADSALKGLPDNDEAKQLTGVIGAALRSAKK